MDTDPSKVAVIDDTCDNVEYDDIKSRYAPPFFVFVVRCPDLGTWGQGKTIEDAFRHAYVTKAVYKKSKVIISQCFDGVWIDNDGQLRWQIDELPKFDQEPIKAFLEKRVGPAPEGYDADYTRKLASFIFQNYAVIRPKPKKK